MPAKQEEMTKVPEKVKEHVAWLRLTDQIEWYDRKSGSNQSWYKWIKLAQLVLATSILVLSLVEVPWWRWITAVLGGLIVVLEGVQQLCQFNNLWISYRSTAERLKHEKCLFLAFSGPYSGLNTDDALKLLSERVEEQVSTEHAKWVNHTRQIEQQQGSSSA
jgi:hypothetical protein